MKKLTFYHRHICYRHIVCHISMHFTINMTFKKMLNSYIEKTPLENTLSHLSLEITYRQTIIKMYKFILLPN